MTTISITTTAMPRAEIFERTLKSFSENLKNLDWKKSKLYLNIDPFINNVADDVRKECLKIANSFVGQVVWRMPEAPNFSLALKWLWETAEDEIILNLEDDWELIREVDLESLIGLLSKRSINHVLLRAWTWNEYSFCLSPGLLTKDLYKYCAMLLDGNLNPEVCIRQNISKFDYNKMIYPSDRNKVILKDLGRKWIKTSGYVRGTGDFVTWEEETDRNRHLHDRLADQNLQIKLEDSALD